MSRTALDVCNLAIVRVGGDRIDAISEDTPAGAYCLTDYPQARDWVLGKYRWTFAGKVAQLARRATTPDDCPAAFAFDLPADLIGAIHDYRVAADRRSAKARTQLINGYVAADQETVWVEYTCRADEAVWPAHFVELVRIAFAAGLAASPVAQNQKLAALLYQQAWGTPEQNGDGGLYLASRTEDSRLAPQRMAFGWMDEGELIAVRGNGASPWSSPFVLPPGLTGPITFIDFTGG